MVLGMRVELIRDLTPTRPSTLRVYQFHHPSGVQKEDVEDTDAPNGVQAVNIKSSACREGEGPDREFNSFRPAEASQIAEPELGFNR